MFFLTRATSSSQPPRVRVTAPASVAVRDCGAAYHLSLRCVWHWHTGQTAEDRPTMSESSQQCAVASGV